MSTDAWAGPVAVGGDDDAAGGVGSFMRAHPIDTKSTAGPGSGAAANGGEFTRGMKKRRGRAVGVNPSDGSGGGSRGRPTCRDGRDGGGGRRSTCIPAGRRQPRRG